MLTSPGHLQPVRTRTWTHTRPQDPHETRDKHTEPHETSTRDKHTIPQAKHIELSCVRGIVSWFMSLMGCGVCMLAASVAVVKFSVALLAHGISMRSYRLTQRLCAVIQNLHIACSCCHECA